MFVRSEIAHKNSLIFFTLYNTLEMSVLLRVPKKEWVGLILQQMRQYATATASQYCCIRRQRPEAARKHALKASYIYKKTHAGITRMFFSFQCFASTKPVTGDLIEREMMTCKGYLDSWTAWSRSLCTSSRPWHLERDTSRFRKK